MGWDALWRGIASRGAGGGRCFGGVCGGRWKQDVLESSSLVMLASG